MYQKAVQSIYQEERNAGNAYRAEYCKSISALIADKKEEARQERDLYAGRNRSKTARLAAKPSSAR